ncbi:MAG: ferrous iron transport protein A [Candidatus Zixiibacteriota bacterium]|nr:MAG: ferrous iron transport protein A [candidate division Zixibacteria bacterium]
MTYLHKLHPGQTARVVGYTEDNPLTRRLNELGLTPGRTVTYLRDAPLRDPLQIRVGECSLALRHTDAALVAVEVDDPAVE